MMYMHMYIYLQLDMTMAQCAREYSVMEQQYEAFQKGLLKFRQNCVIAGITSASLSSIEQCVLALRSSLMADKEMLLVNYWCLNTVTYCFILSKVLL